jgi:nitrite reductase/ring-hydroxylating ferredoxin subunit
VRYGWEYLNAHSVASTSFHIPYFGLTMGIDRSTFCLSISLLAFRQVHSFAPSKVQLITPSFASRSHIFRRTALSEESSVIVDDTTSTKLDSPGPTFQLGAWMPLGSASCLTGLTPVQIRVCGIDIAVWHKPLTRDANKDAVATQWSALVDACPHRLAPLSQGRVDPNSGCIECPYHGWAFDTDGTLMALPQLDEGRIIEGSIASNGAATSLPVHASGDLLFVFLPTDVTGESWP